MALTKVTKHIVFGSQLIAHYGKDMSDLTSSSSSLVQWDTTTVTPQYSDSHLEIVLTGSAFTGSNFTTGGRYGNLTFRVNGTDEYYQNGVIGGYTSNAGERHWHNPRHSQHNGRQQFHYYNFGNAVYANHIHAPGTTNAQVIQVMCSSDSSQFNITWKDGFLTVSEIAGDHYNFT